MPLVTTKTAKKPNFQGNGGTSMPGPTRVGGRKYLKKPRGVRI